MTPAEATRRSRRAQGLPDTIRDPGVLDELAALIAATSSGTVAVSIPTGKPTGGDAHARATA